MFDENYFSTPVTGSQMHDVSEMQKNQGSRAAGFATYTFFI